MDNNKYRNKYRIPSARATWHDYNYGEYFITICTYDMQYYFGEIRDERMQMTEIGTYVNEQIKNITSHYPYIHIPLWVVMPNHIHAIVYIEKSIGSVDHMSTITTELSCNKKTIHEGMQKVSQHRGLLSIMIGGLKRAVTRYANVRGIEFRWQSRFHDHIIRNSDEKNRIAKYIENNVVCWNDDCYNDI